MLISWDEVKILQGWNFIISNVFIEDQRKQNYQQQLNQVENC